MATHQEKHVFLADFIFKVILVFLFSSWGSLRAIGPSDFYYPMSWFIISCLNFHFLLGLTGVHPGEILDPGRGSEEGCFVVVLL